MSDHIEHPCRRCGSLLHHKDGLCGTCYSELGPDAFGQCYMCREAFHSDCVGVPCSCECPARPYVIYTLDERGHGDVCLWWKPQGCGYTRYLDEAGRFSKAEASARVGSDGDVVVALAVAEHAAKRVVPISKLEGAEEAFQKARKK